MSDVVQKAAEAAAKIADLQKERAERLASADAHEHAARADRLRASQCKAEIAEWTVALQSHQVRHQVETAQEAASKAKAAAEANEAKSATALADIEKMKAELAETLAKAKAATEAIPKEAKE